MLTKKCCKCDRSLSLENFYAQKQGKHGKSTICKECKAEYSRSPERKAYFKKYRKSVKGQLGRRKEIAKRFDITLGEYDQMFEGQKGMCGICNQSEVGYRLCVDHDHRTGKIRGLLCRSCNVLLGYLERMERDDFAKKAKNYLRNSS